MKKIILIMLVLIISFACSKKEDNTKKSENKKIRIVTTLFPTYDFSKEIGKDKVEVKLLLPPGIEAHSYEPTPKDIAEINNADIFIYTGDLMEPWVKKLLSSLNNKNLKIVDVSKNIELKEFDFEDEHNDKDIHENEEEHIHGKDPHIWTDPVLAKTIVQNIADSIIEVDLANKSFYDGNKIIYDKKLDNLDIEFKNLVK